MKIKHLRCPNLSLKDIFADVYNPGSSKCQTSRSANLVNNFTRFDGAHSDDF